MVYEFYNPETNETKFFITEPKGIFSVYVEHNIHHGYRNIDPKNTSYTMNSLNKLYKGFGRNDEPDEIRHEKTTTNNKVLFIFGAGGLLGSELYRVAYEKVGKHTFEIIPCFEKILDQTDFKRFEESINSVLANRDVTFINCAALTNTKDLSSLDKNWGWTNAELPVKFLELCNKNKWNFVQLSTNYVYQQVKPNILNYSLSVYTKSKLLMEEYISDHLNQSTTLLRVSNLYNTNSNKPNIFTRFKEIIETTGKIIVDPNEYVAPTCTTKLSEKIIELFLINDFNVNGLQKINIVPRIYNLDSFVKEIFNITPEYNTSKVNGGIEKFTNDFNAKIIKL
jgi:dTDP-4-dehydrorhamnose reductase